jgi:VanZ family protein
MWLLVIFFASSDGFSASNTSFIIRPLVLWLFPDITVDQIARIHVVTRKLAHFCEYALLGVLAARAFRNSPGLTIKRNWFLISLGLVVVYALVDEYHQSFVPSRTASLVDSLIDIFGGLTALLVVKFVFARKDASN